MLKRILDAIAQPYHIDGQTIEISASLGVTLYPEDSGDIDILVRHADNAMYQAKLVGKNRYHLFDAEHDQELSLKHQQLDEIEQALSRNEFCLYYQPKVNMKTGKVYGAEALIRWLHPTKGLIPPLDFLPAIEETALEIQIGEWVIEQALEQIAQWNRLGITLEVSINIASFHLRSTSFINQLENSLLKHPEVKPCQLQLEILESSALGDTRVISNAVKSCQAALGVKVALDDFGTGYSSLTHLRELPAETLKIDQSFVRHMLDDHEDFTIVDGIIGLAESFDRKVIAEGVETSAHGQMLLSMGCELAQGYGIARPMPATEIPDWLNSYTPLKEWRNAIDSASSKKEKRAQQIRLSLEQWQRQIEQTIQTPPDKLQRWPIMDKTKCSCGSWIRRERHEQVFNSAWLEELDQAHEKAHLVANSLKLLYQENELDTAREGLAQFRKALIKMDELLSRAD